MKAENATGNGKAKLLAVCGEKNSGKTTLIERLLPLLRAQGIRTAALKHDGHSFSADVPGTDTFRFLQAGACGTAVFDGEKFMLVRNAPIDPQTLAAFFPEAELVLVEGMKRSGLPKLALADGQVSCSFSEKTFGRDDVAGIAALLLLFAERQGETHA